MIIGRFDCVYWNMTVPADCSCQHLGWYSTVINCFCLTNKLQHDWKFTHPTVFHQINAPCMLMATLANSEGLRPYYRSCSAIFAHFWQVFVYFEGKIPSESAGMRLLKQAHLFGKIHFILSHGCRVKYRNKMGNLKLYISSSDVFCS